MKVRVELADRIDVGLWRAEHERGLRPDGAPYGLDLLARPGTTVEFRTPPTNRRILRIGEQIQARLHGVDAFPTVVDVLSRAHRDIDLVLCPDERTGVPAALATRRAAVVTGAVWLEDPSRMRNARRRLMKAGLDRAAAVFSYSQHLAGVFADRWGIAASKAHWVPFGIDVEFYAEQPWADDQLVFSVGDDRRRDHQTLVAAFLTARRTRPDARLEVATTLPLELDSSWGTVVRRRLGADIRTSYGRANVVAVAIEPGNQAGSGLTTVLGAMAAARPVVVTSNPGLDAYIRDGVDGLLVPPGDAAAMGEAIARLLADSDRARAMGRAARLRVRREFSSQHMADHLHTLLCAVV